MEKLIEKSCVDFTDVLSSRAPVPGGGGASALVGALGTALYSMVGNLTLGRKKYAEFESDIIRMLQKGEKLQKRLLELVDKDAEVFEPLQKAYSIPKDEPGRDEIMYKVSMMACEAPFEIMKCCCEAIELAEEMLEKGSVTLVSDTGCGAMFCLAAIESASMNIFVNTKSLSGEEVEKLELEVNRMRKEYIPRAQAVADAVQQRLHR